MNGRKRLTWVTALTVASLLLGGGALNAFAQGHGDGGGVHGGSGGQANKSAHQPPPGVANQGNNDGESPQGQQPTHGQAKPAPAAPAQQNLKHDDQEHNQNNGAANNNNSNNNNNKDKENNNVQRVDDDQEDLVTPPSRVTGEDRPGLGCGDDNHPHTGAPGNPDATCKPHEDDQGMNDDNSATAAPTMADEDSQAAAVVDDRAGD
jgi:hypothetical protein